MYPRIVAFAVLQFLSVGLLDRMAAAQDDIPADRPVLHAGRIDTRQPVDQGAPRPYRFPRFGITLDIPANYSIGLGPKMTARGADFSMTPEYPGEYLFAELEPAGHKPYIPVTAGAISAIYLGVRLGISRNECLEPLANARYTQGGTVQLGGNDFEWKEIPFVGRLAIPNAHYTNRDYAGFVNSVCYEFHVRVSVLERQNVLPDFESILGSAEFFSRMAPPRATLESPDTPFAVPADVINLLEITDWKIVYPKHLNPWPRAETTVCGMRELAESNIIQFEHASQSDPADATKEINKVESEVLGQLAAKGWARLPEGLPPAPDVVDCFAKDGAAIHVEKGPGCAGNGPCQQYDTYTVTAYLPAGPYLASSPAGAAVDGPQSK
jgi:hypothetical protein